MLCGKPRCQNTGTTPRRTHSSFYRSGQIQSNPTAGTQPRRCLHGRRNETHFTDFPIPDTKDKSGNNRLFRASSDNPERTTFHTSARQEIPPDRRKGKQTQAFFPAGRLKWTGQQEPPKQIHLVRRLKRWLRLGQSASGPDEGHSTVGQWKPCPGKGLADADGVGPENPAVPLKHE